MVTLARRDDEQIEWILLERFRDRTKCAFSTVNRTASGEGIVKARFFVGLIALFWAL
jgi:hypothetical protein